MTLIVRTLGIQPYQPIWQAMQDFTAQRTADTPDEIWLLEHEPTFTQGAAGKAEHILVPIPHIPIVNTDRGGQVTYHAPGQLIAYVMINLKRRQLSVRQMVTLLENTVIELLAEAGITAQAKPDAPGVYVNQRKIASLGLKIKQGCTFHGLALNISMDLKPFTMINPCGYHDLSMINTAECSSLHTVAQTIPLLAQKLAALLHAPHITWQQGFHADVKN